MTKFISIFSVLLMLIAVSVYAARDEATARAIWNFDEGDAADTSGNNVNGRLVGNPEVVDGIVGKAFQFDGEDDGIKLPDANGLNTGGPLQKQNDCSLFQM